jgi:hypothetical protein
MSFCIVMPWICVFCMQSYGKPPASAASAAFASMEQQQLQQQQQQQQSSTVSSVSSPHMPLQYSFGSDNNSNINSRVTRSAGTGRQRSK